tara:strand:- start:24 stop:257 length:234 start_codon:yes stop_codon:yes gene_type:complete
MTRDLSTLQILDQDWNSDFLNKVSAIKKQFSERKGTKIRNAPSKKNFEHLSKQKSLSPMEQKFATPFLGSGVAFAPV